MQNGSPCTLGHDSRLLVKYARSGLKFGYVSVSLIVDPAAASMTGSCCLVNSCEGFGSTAEPDSVSGQYVPVLQNDSSYHLFHSQASVDEAPSNLSMVHQSRRLLDPDSPLACSTQVSC
jgi:hypothetical protein